jgi:hypothetical protein
VREISWAWPRFPRSGYRLDHVLASPELRPVRAVYHHEWLIARLSDRSALEVDLEAARPLGGDRRMWASSPRGTASPRPRGARAGSADVRIASGPDRPLLYVAVP